MSGVYTGLRFKGVVKQEFRPNFNLIAASGDWLSHPDIAFHEFGKLRNASNIPNGSLQHMPGDWDEDDEEFLNHFDSLSGVWTFQCSTCNYNQEIEHFFKLLPHFIESVQMIEVFPEEDDYGYRYDLIDGEVKLVDESYKYYESTYWKRPCEIEDDTNEDSEELEF